MGQSVYFKHSQESQENTGNLTNKLSRNLANWVSGKISDTFLSQSPVFCKTGKREMI